jgi:murein DD-endopeptidase MepM/ murein hydrolase activator NlpD
MVERTSLNKQLSKSMESPLALVLLRHQHEYHSVVEFDPAVEKLAPLNLSQSGTDLPSELAADLPSFTAHMEKLRKERNAAYLVGGYNELRAMYGRSELFDQGGEPRRLHLGTDLWAPAGKAVYAFLGGMVHSVGNNAQMGDYGATMILLHQLEGFSFYSLYGHISLNDIRKVSPGQYLSRGQKIAHLGSPAENGQWPPHLHFQLIADLGGRQGDYPGVCRYSERANWLANSPEPDIVLQLNKYLS